MAYECTTPNTYVSREDEAERCFLTGRGVVFSNDRGNFSCASLKSLCGNHYMRETKIGVSQSNSRIQIPVCNRGAFFRNTARPGPLRSGIKKE